MRSHLPFFILVTSLTGTALNLSADPITIMPLGDSITAGVGSSDGTGYRYPLYTDLNAANLSFKFVGSAPTNPNSTINQSFFTSGDGANNGYGHYQINDILHNLDKDTLVPSADDNQGGNWLSVANPNPNIILLLIGTNDFLQQNFADIDTNITNLVSKIELDSPHSKILIAGTIPILDDAPNPPFPATGNVGFNTLISGYDSFIQNTLVNEFPNLTYVNQYANFVNPDDNTMLNVSLYSDDGIHPDADGYAKIAATWDTAILAAEAPEPGDLSLLGASVLVLLVFGGLRKKFNI